MGPRKRLRPDATRLMPKILASRPKLTSLILSHPQMCNHVTKWHECEANKIHYGQQTERAIYPRNTAPAAPSISAPNTGLFL